MTRTVPLRLVRFLASQVAAATGGRLVGPDVELRGASFDSRSLQPGDLFVPIVAERDGHEFLGEAAARGAGAALSSRAADPTIGITIIEVADTRQALLDLATWARGQLPASVVGITGSVGKTSTKDLTVAAVGAGRRVAANTRSFNNEQGLPVTVLGAPDDVEVLVLEMGMRGPGEITRLCAVGRPEIGVVTAVAEAHTELLGGIDGVARAKAELVDALPSSGVAVLNADDPRVTTMAGRTAARVLRFGRHADADVRIMNLVLDELARPTFTVATPWGECAVRLTVSGAHMASNAAAALAVAGVVGVDITVAAAALAQAALSARRMQVVTTVDGGLLINDAYNANPASMAAALEALAAIEAERRVAVLGVMAELADPTAEHRAIAQRAAELGIELVAVETEHYGSMPIRRDAVRDAIVPIVAGTAVLVKGSLVAGLGPVADELAS